MDAILDGSPLRPLILLIVLAGGASICWVAFARWTPRAAVLAVVASILTAIAFVFLVVALNMVLEVCKERRRRPLVVPACLREEDGGAGASPDAGGEDALPEYAEEHDTPPDYE
jgi:energy-converting hydrogenase Eha subunit C